VTPRQLLDPAHAAPTFMPLTAAPALRLVHCGLGHLL
jgi:hypothetical protein